jgi:hypothetical protein
MQTQTQATTAMPTTPKAPRKRTVKATSPAVPRAIKVLSKDEKQALRAEVKYYTAATPERQVEMIERFRWSLAHHLGVLRQRAYRELPQRADVPSGADFIADTLFWAHVNRALLATIAPPTSPAPPVDDIALLTEHQADEYLRTCNDEQPDELIRARHSEPLAPAQTTPANKRNPFAKLISAGD